MNVNPITADTKVAKILTQHPDTIDIFLRHGCPDMSHGLFKLMSNIMPLKLAAFVHRIPLDQLLSELNARANAAGNTNDSRQANADTSA